MGSGSRDQGLDELMSLEMMEGATGVNRERQQRGGTGRRGEGQAFMIR